MNEIYISVIITAYNRREFLLDAITSVVNQTLGREKYEIILIKNFKDEDIDRIVNENGIGSVNLEGTIGEYLKAGLEQAKGEVISFMEDDDIFCKDKLEVVYDLFKSNEKLVYFHNISQFINENKNPISRFGRGLDFNLSSISIRKNILNPGHLNKNLFSLQDSFMLYSAYENGGLVVSGDRVLSYYRLHNSASNILEDGDTRAKFKLKLSQNFISQLEVLYKKFKSSKARKHILNYMTSLKINVNIFTKLHDSNIKYKIESGEVFHYLLIFNYWGKRRNYPLKFLKLMEMHLPEHILKKILFKDIL